MSPVFMNRLGARLRQQFAQVLGHLHMNAGDVVMHYDSAVPPVGFDRNDSSTYPTKVPATREFRALIHYISDTSRSYGPQEFEVGDVLLFFKPEQDVSGNDPWFEVQGRPYVQKECGNFLSVDWSLEVGGRLIHRAMLLTLKRGQPQA